MSEPVEAVRAKPGEFFLAAESVEVGTRFRAGGALYEVMTEPSKWGVAWVATVKVIEGLRPGSEFRAMLHTGEQVE